MLARKVILKMEKINVQVTLKDPLIETLRYFVATSLSNQFPLFQSGFSLIIHLNLSRVNFYNSC